LTIKAYSLQYYSVGKRAIVKAAIKVTSAIIVKAIAILIISVSSNSKNSISSDFNSNSESNINDNVKTATIIIDVNSNSESSISSDWPKLHIIKSREIIRQEGHDQNILDWNQ
jgi:hypothetical protein